MVPEWGKEHNELADRWVLSLRFVILDDHTPHRSKHEGDSDRIWCPTTTLPHPQIFLDA